MLTAPQDPMRHRRSPCAVTTGNFPQCASHVPDRRLGALISLVGSGMDHPQIGQLWVRWCEVAVWFAARGGTEVQLVSPLPVYGVVCSELDGGVRDLVGGGCRAWWPAPTRDGSEAVHSRDQGRRSSSGGGGGHRVPPGVGPRPDRGRGSE